MEMPAPVEEHKWLQELIGEWTSTGEMKMGEEEMKSSGTETITAFGGFWTVGEMRGKMPGSDVESKSVITLGYDVAKKKYVGTFVSDMMGYLWVYEGTRKGNVLTLDAEGPSFKGDGSLAKYQDIIEIRSEKEYELRSQVLGEDGTWTPFMSMIFKRTK
ncbi:hypothetical protein IZ6_14290 [Terrihabitans soli]|uniref:DUF1579 domain-containing protein n=1 Tax=Terrihabitans soli TaxID=708113 RepID=A0A6S6QK40_9HYPH|nr:DUF1579 domain-containing protein [Terrihabitans soli]BCJ90694.1 hypothetical protein IZ6_14290 [Terrihabitans soli]